MSLKISPAIPSMSSGIVAVDCVTILSALEKLDSISKRPSPSMVPCFDSRFSSS